MALAVISWSTRSNVREYTGLEALIFLALDDDEARVTDGGME
jgi:hypothetical protein